MSPDDLAESEPEGEGIDPAEDAEGVADTIGEWPADAIPTEPIEPAWAPGEVLGYAKAAKPRLLPGQARPSRVSPIVGTITLAFALAAAVAIAGGCFLAFFASRRPVLSAPAIMIAEVIVTLGCLCTPTAIVLGTIGRLNPECRSCASLGRRIACGIPLAFFAIMLVVFIRKGEVSSAILALGRFVFTLVVGFVILVTTDAILGTD
jgi:hypothetical protein